MSALEKVPNISGPFLSWDAIFSFIFNKVSKGPKYWTNTGEEEKTRKKGDKKIFFCIRRFGDLSGTLGPFTGQVGVGHGR